MDWGAPEFLLLGAAAAAVFAILVARSLRRRRWILEQMVGPELLGRLTGTAEDRFRKAALGLRWLGLVLLALAAAAPRWGREVIRVSGQGSDLVLLFDLSQSMAVSDVPPRGMMPTSTASRLCVKAP